MCEFDWSSLIGIQDDSSHEITCAWFGRFALLPVLAAGSFLVTICKLTAARICILLITVYTWSAVQEQNTTRQQFPCLTVWAEAAVAAALFFQHV
jgi:hypothetical protein